MVRSALKAVAVTAVVLVALSSDAIAATARCQKLIYHVKNGKGWVDPASAILFVRDNQCISWSLVQPKNEHYKLKRIHVVERTAIPRQAALPRQPANELVRYVMSTDPQTVTTRDPQTINQTNIDDKSCCALCTCDDVDAPTCKLSSGACDAIMTMRATAETQDDPTSGAGLNLLEIGPSVVLQCTSPNCDVLGEAVKRFRQRIGSCRGACSPAEIFDASHILVADIQAALGAGRH